MERRQFLSGYKFGLYFKGIGCEFGSLKGWISQYGIVRDNLSKL